MKEAKKRKLMLGAGALTIIGLIWYASAGAAQSENQNGTVGGGYSPPIITTEPSQTGEGTSYAVQFPTITIPTMPTYTAPVLPSFDSGDYYTTTGTKKSQNYIPANIPGNDTGTDYGITILGPATTASERTDDPGARAYYSSLINSGVLDTPQIVPGTKKEHTFTKEELERGYVGH